MKKLFLCYVMIFSLLFAVCGCSNYVSPQQGTDFGGTEEPDKPPDKEQEETGNNEPLSPEVTMPPVTPPPIEPPPVEPPSVESPEVTPPPDEPPLNIILELNELRYEYQSDLNRVEFIEFKAKKTGNLNGISLHIISNKENPFIYYFPAIDVALGEYITLHLRTVESGCIDELGDNLSLSVGYDSCPTARDLWVSGSKKLLSHTDIVYLQDEYGRFIDAVVMNSNPKATWGIDQSHFAEIIEILFNAGMWKSADGQMPTPFDAVFTSTMSTTITRSVSRYEKKENTHTVDNWYLTANGSATPGLPNK